MESIEQTFNGQADFGRRVTCTTGATATLLTAHLQVGDYQKLTRVKKRLGDVYARWLDFPGEQLISQVEVEIADSDRPPIR